MFGAFTKPFSFMVLEIHADTPVGRSYGADKALADPALGGGGGALNVQDIKILCCEFF
jgi:hypothetical protein